MDPHRFRPELWEVEDRVTPSTTPGDVFAGLAAVPADAAVLRYAAEEPGVLVAAARQPLGRATLSLIEARSAAAARSLGDFLGSLGNTVAANPGLAEFLTPYVEQAAGAFFQANANAAVARAFGQVVDRIASGVGFPAAGFPGTLTGATGATGTAGTATGTGVTGIGTGTATTLGGSTPTGTSTGTVTPNAGTTGTTTGVSGNPGTSTTPTGTSGTTTGTTTGGTTGTDATTTNTTTSGTSAGTTGGTV